MTLNQSRSSGDRSTFGLFPPSDLEPRPAGAELPAILSELPKVERAWPDLRADRLTVFVCCDSIYFERHGLPFARSLDRNSPGTHLHIHLINPDAGSKRHLGELDLANTAFSHSAEFFDFDGLSAEFMRTYCASIRFVRQYQLLAASQRPVIAFDVDVLIRGSLEPLRNELVRGSYDCAVHARLKSRKRREKFLLSAFYVSPSRVGLGFLEDLAIRIALPLLQRDAGWYMDQEALYETYRAHRMVGPPVRFYHLPKGLSDWDFDKRSAIWVAKGWRKDSSDKFVAHQDVYRTDNERLSRLPRLAVSNPRVGIVLPDLALSFRKPRGLKGLCSRIKGQDVGTKRLRKYWGTFAEALRSEYVERGYDVSIVTRPLWRVTEEFVASLGLDVVFLPHAHRFEFPTADCRTYFYMQVVFPWLFSVDPLGWSGASSRYPCDYGAGNQESGVFEACVDRVVAQNGGKFGQPPRVTRQRLVERGEIPDAPYIFFPCQRPNDQSIELFCDHEAGDVQRIGPATGDADVPLDRRLHLAVHPPRPPVQFPQVRLALAAAGGGRRIARVDVEHRLLVSVLKRLEQRAGAGVGHSLVDRDLLFSRLVARSAGRGVQLLPQFLNLDLQLCDAVSGRIQLPLLIVDLGSQTLVLAAKVSIALGRGGAGRRQQGQHAQGKAPRGLGPVHVRAFLVPYWDRFLGPDCPFFPVR